MYFTGFGDQERETEDGILSLYGQILQNWNSTVKSNAVSLFWKTALLDFLYSPT